MTPTYQTPRIPMFMLQLPLRTLNRIGLHGTDWEGLVESLLNIRVRDDQEEGAFIGLEAYCGFLQIALLLFGRDRLLRWYVEDIRPQHLGPACMAMVTAPCVGHALDILLENAAVLMPALSVHRHDSEEAVVLTFRPCRDMMPVVDPYMEMAVLTVAKFLVKVGAGLADVRLTFAHPAALPKAYYRDAFGLEPSFAAPETTLVMQSACLAMGNAEHLPVMHQDMRHAARQLLEACASRRRVDAGVCGPSAGSANKTAGTGSC